MSLRLIPAVSVVASLLFHAPAEAIFFNENPFPAATFDQPVQVAFLPDGRTLVAEKSGWVSLIQADGTQEHLPFISLRGEVLGTFDRGLLGMAVNPDFETDPWIYFLYPVDPNGDFNDEELDTWCRVTRYRPRVDDPDRADVGSREVILGATWSDGIPSMHTSHTIGTLKFAPDGTLMVGAGDGAHWEMVDTGGLDPDGFGAGKTDPSEDIGAFRARSVDSLAGKILRIDPETGDGLPSNPFYDGDVTSDRSKVYAYGTRNPFRFCLDPSTGSTDPAMGDPGVIVIGDVGWSTYEFLHVVDTPGQNLGWPCFEGPQATAYQSETTTFTGNTNVLCGATPNPENPNPETPPRGWLHHGNGALSSPWDWTGASITGGVFYEGGDYPAEYVGRYFLGEFIGNWIRTVDFDENYDIVSWSNLIDGASGPVNVEVHPVTGDIWYVAYFNNQVRTLNWVGTTGADEVATTPSVTISAAPNPFRRSTSIDFQLGTAGEVRVAIFDAQGRAVRDLQSARLDAGAHSVSWDGRDDAGRQVGAGTYFYRLFQDDVVMGGGRLARVR